MKKLIMNWTAALPKSIRRRSWGKGATAYIAEDLRGADVTALEAYDAYGGRPCIVTIRLGECRWFGASGLSYDIESLHPYVRTLADYAAGRYKGYDGSFLDRFWQAWQPSNLAEYLRLDPRSCNPALLEIPPAHDILPWSAGDGIASIRAHRWGDQKRKLCSDGYTPAGSCGPKPRWYGERRIRKLVTLFERIKQEGYRHSPPQHLSYGKQHIRATCLVRGRDARYLIVDGQHRSASLAVLGHRDVPVVVHSPMNRGGSPIHSVVRLDEVRLWPLVRAGLFSIDEATQVFCRVFDAVPPRQVQEMDAAAFRPGWSEPARSRAHRDACGPHAT